MALNGRKITAEVEQQIRFDRERPSPQGVLAARARALAETHRAMLAGEDGARPAFKGGLVDLAAAIVCAERIDHESDPFLEAPEMPHTRY